MSNTKDKTLTDDVRLRCSAGQLLRWRAQARREGRSLSSWIRRQLDIASGKRETTDATA